MRGWPRFALERLEQRRLLAADVRAGAPVDEDRDVAADVRAALQLLQRGDEHLVRARVLAADVDEHRLRLDRVRGDQAALDEPVRDAGEDLVVLEAARLRLVGVDDEVVRLRDLIGLRDEPHFMPVAKNAPPRPRSFDAFTSSITASGAIAARLRERLVAADRLVLGELRQVALVGVREDDLPVTRHAFSSDIAQLLDDPADALRLDVQAVVVVDRDDGRPAAAAEALDRPQRHLAVLGRLAGPAAELRLERLEHLLRADERARDVRADLDQVLRPTGARWYMS